MSYSIGGALITDMELTYSWGMSPASASITCVGASGVTANDDAVLSIGGSTFYGVVANVVDEILDGTKTKISFVDNRVKLQWDDVYALFNRTEIREDNPATRGIDRQKRFVHILPADWDKQIKTYTDTAYTAQEIINFCLGAATVENPWSTVFDAAQSKAIKEIDANTGKKLGNVLQEISEAQGLLFTLVGNNQLVWARKGDGFAPASDPVAISESSVGEAISAVDTRVTIVGDRNRYQEINIDLEPDWITAYEAFWAEPFWLDEVSGAFGLANTSFADRAALAAKSRKVTLRDYCALRGPQLADYGMWGEICRMEIPVWTYLQDIVYKAYRVPRGYSFNGIPLESLELVEGLLCAVQYSLTGQLTYKSESDRLYPDTKAFMLVQGQQLGLLDPTKQRVISEQELTRAATEYAPNNRFNLDTRNKTVIFEDAVFNPGSGDNALFVFPNKSVAGASDAFKAIAVPNAAAKVTKAKVVAALVWDAERYNRIFGNGPRKGPVNVPGLSLHKMFNGGSDQGEINYGDNHTADEKAQEIAGTITAQFPTYASGSYKRQAGYGTQLTGVIDRVTVSLTFGGGISERVELSKERPQSNFEGERDLERKHRARDLFPGQTHLRADVENLELIAKVSKELTRSPLVPVYGSLAETLENPVGVGDCSVSKIYSTDQWIAGQPVFLDKNDEVSKDGTRFAGIVIADKAKGLISVATQGIVPVRVVGPLKTGDDIGIDAGAGQTAKKGGTLALGKANMDYDGTAPALLPVRLGAGSGGVAVGTKPWDPLSVPFTGTGTPPDDQGRKFRVAAGFVNSRLPNNWQFVFTAPPNLTDQPYWAWLEIGVSTPLAITGVTINTGQTLPTPVVASGHNLPTPLYIPLFYLFTAEKAITSFQKIENTSLTITQDTTNLSCETADYAVVVSR